MSLQRDILSRTLHEFTRGHPECTVLLIGSVATGDERPDSDLDLIVISPPDADAWIPDGDLVHEEQGMRLVERVIDSVRVHYACWSEDAFVTMVAAAPYRHYPFALGRILADPSGVIAAMQDVIRRDADARPGVVAAWRRQLEALQKKKRDASCAMDYPEWSQFIKYLDALVEESPE